ncbi:hypothetical protein WB44_03635 [Synechococcus sp. WH 8020]|nr:hypothetical protein WB44_03635 [Synechococcus sp. WH 8020]
METAIIETDHQTGKTLLSNSDCQKTIESLKFGHKLESHQFGKAEKNQSSLFTERDGGFTMCKMEFNVRQQH